jgi:peptidoglycan-N-acetylglucosamine deacetylase
MHGARPRVGEGPLGGTLEPMTSLIVRWARAAAVLGLLLGAAAWTEPGVVRSGPTACKAIALTFDLCPVKEGTGFDAALVRELVAHRIHATFFPSGKWMTTHDAALRELLAVPYFELGTHGETHASLPKLSGDDLRREITAPVTRLAREYGRTARLFRPPYGDYTAASVAAVHDAGLTFVLWSVVSGDPDPKLPAARIEQDVETRARNGSIIIFHANGRGWHTAEVVEDVYQRLVVEKGFTPLTVSELLAGCADHAGSGSSR